jgi:glycosyltransferase involved in cell wall biosynthesis
MLSVIIAARNEKYLEPTIRNILANARGEIEIIVELDGYLPDPRIDIGDNRVLFIHHKESIGQRQCINDGARRAKGKYIMKLDAHCAVDEGFDVKLAADCEYDWTIIPRMYNLDINTFQPKLHKRTDYMYMGCATGRLLRAEYYSGKEYSRWHKKKELIDDTMCNMGPGWFLHKDRFWELGGLDEGHGGWGQMGVEISCKAWLSGGSLKVNKKTWFSHWFRGGSGPGFPYPGPAFPIKYPAMRKRELGNTPETYGLMTNGRLQRGSSSGL